MKLSQNDLEYLYDQVSQKKMTADEANVEKVRMQRVLVVTCRLPREVRTALNKAVKAGKLKHLKKDGLKPECYYHPTFEHLVNGERNKHERKILKASSSILA